jgi:hypothetical protein
VTRQTEFSSRVGNRWSFAVEFEACGDRPRRWNEWWGSLWLWADGYVVGRPFEIEMVMSGFDPLLGSIYQAEQNTENRTSALLASLPANQALEWVMWAQCGEDDPPKGFQGDEALLGVHEVLPRGSPFFDDWQAILLPEGLHERFIFRRDQGEPSEARWPRGTFRSVVLQAQDEFKKLARAHMVPPASA